jgi:hypothetical protein
VLSYGTGTSPHPSLATSGKGLITIHISLSDKAIVTWNMIAPKYYAVVLQVVGDRFVILPGPAHHPPQVPKGPDSDHDRDNVSRPVFNQRLVDSAHPPAIPSPANSGIVGRFLSVDN